MALFIYGTATNTGKGFFTAEDRRNFFLRGYPGDVWVVGNSEKGALWLAEKNGVEKTKAEAQAIVDAEVTAAQAAYDALPDEQKNRPGFNQRPTAITLPQVNHMTTYNQLAGLRVNYVSSDPTLNTGNEGQVWYNSTSGTLKSLVQIKTFSAGSNMSTARQLLAGCGTQTAALAFGGGPPNTNVTEEYS